VYVTHSIPNSEIKEAPAVLLLHGAKFSSTTWEKTQTIQVGLCSISVPHARVFVPDSLLPVHRPPCPHPGSFLYVLGPYLYVVAPHSCLQMLVDSGFHAYTVDLPGFGRSEGKVDDALRSLFLEVRQNIPLASPIHRPFCASQTRGLMVSVLSAGPYCQAGAAEPLYRDPVHVGGFFGAVCGQV
jgi:pimeloyl-ACP methyl ester carboxylesterase